MAIRKTEQAPKEEFVPEQMTEREIRKASGEVEVPPTFNREQLGAIDSFDAAMALATATFGSIIAAHEQPILGDGFRVATEDDKYRLCGVPLLLLDWTFKASDFGQDQDWVLIHAVQRGDSGQAVKWVIADGGTGIARDLKEFTDKTGRVGGMVVKNGLRVSKYYIDPDSKEALTKRQVAEVMTSGRTPAEAQTFYLDTSA